MNKRVLVIDDEAPVREAIHDILETIEIEVFGASTGQEGIRLFEQHRADIAAVMIDMKMPYMTGTEIVARIREIDPNAKIILSSAYQPAEIRQMINDQVPDHYLTKPFDLHTLIELIQNFVDGPLA